MLSVEVDIKVDKELVLDVIKEGILNNTLSDTRLCKKIIRTLVLENSCLFDVEDLNVFFKELLEDVRIQCEES